MIKKRISIALIAVGVFFIAATLFLGFMGIPKPGFGKAKIALGIAGLCILVVGMICFLRREKTSNLWNRIKPSTTPEIILLIAGMTVGLLFCTFIPYGAGFDESAHVIRVFDISDLHIIPNQGDEKAFEQFYTFSYQRRYFESPAFDQFSKQVFFAKPVWDTMTTGATRSTYFPLNYVIEAIVAGVFWQVLNFPVIPVIILIRLAGFIFYLLACYFTLRLLPVGKWVFLVLALSPMALFQASTINIDGFTNAISFLFIGYILKTYSERNNPIDMNKTWMIFLLSILIGCVKPGTILILLLLLLLVKNKFKAKQSIYIIFLGVFLSVSISLLWSYFEVANLQLNSSSDATLLTRVMLALHTFPDFIRMFARGIVLSFATYYHDWVGVYGYWVGKVPVLTYLFYPLALGLAFFAEEKSQLITKKARILIFLVGLICLVGIASYQFFYNYTPGVQGTGAQGRYFIPFAPLVFLALAGLFFVPARFRGIIRWGASGFLLMTIIVYGYGLFQTYYTNCGSSITADHPCTLPIYKNLDLVKRYVATVTPEVSVSQSFLPVCDQVSSVMVRIQLTMSEAQDKVLFTLQDENKQTILSQEFLLSPLKQDTMLKMPVNLQVTPGKTRLWLSFSLPVSDSENASFGILGRKGADIYADGDLLFNSTPQDGDLVFQYTCVK